MAKMGTIHARIKIDGWWREVLKLELLALAARHAAKAAERLREAEG